MKRLLLLALGFGLASSASAQSLLLTGIGDPDGGLGKIIEIYVLEDVADLTAYGVESANNGNPSGGSPEFILSGTATAGEFIYLTANTLDFASFMEFFADATTSAASINGDDAVLLYYDAGGDGFSAADVVDVYGVPGTDGTGEAWEYSDGWAYRNSGTAASTTWVPADWDVNIGGTPGQGFEGASSSDTAIPPETNREDAPERFPVSTYRNAAGTKVVQYPSATAGARFVQIGIPVTGYDVADLATLNHVQGVPGGTNPQQSPGADDNLFTRFLAQNTPGDAPTYGSPATTDVILAPGEGFFWYLFDSEFGPFGGGTSKSYPTIKRPLVAHGTVPSANIDVAFAATNRNAADEGFYMIANPYAEPMDAFGISKTAGNGTVGAIFQAWDPDAGTYAAIDGSLDGGTFFAVFQGAFAEVDYSAVGAGLETAPTISFDVTEQDASATPVFSGRRAATPRIALDLTGTTTGGTTVADGIADVTFRDDAIRGRDRYDASEIAPPTPFSAQLAIRADGRFQAIRSLPATLDAPVAMPVAFRTNADGAFRIALGDETLLAGMMATLEDAVTGEIYDLADGLDLAFDAAATEWTDRFMLTVASVVVATDGDAPELAVGDVYPNPAAGPARLDVSVDVAQRVTVNVFDALGRAVATAFDGDVAAGVAVSVALPDGLAPGAYVVRVAGATVAETRRLVVVR